ncbi:MAG: signal recognition particle-docking protein FtsY, partial [Synechocystis sp.]
MFNWFRRQFGNDVPAQESVAPEAPQETVASPDEPEAEQPEALPSSPAAETITPDPEVAPPEDTPSETPDPNDYLNWAKAAYQNIQARKGETPAPTAVEGEAPADSVVADSPETVAPESGETTAPPVIEPSETVTTPAPDAGPAWLQKSDRLEALKETAVEAATVDGTL